MDKRRPSEIWFPAKRYGWGWGIPVTWQGWAVLVGYFVLLFFLWTVLSPDRHPTIFAIAMIGSTAGLIFICYKKGERPAWRWGGDDYP